jgi:hypothetical protein
MEVTMIVTTLTKRDAFGTKKSALDSGCHFPELVNAFSDARVI